jgi:site-specific DNA recombinase
MDCVLYARVSTEKQAEKELSIPAQLEAMRAYAGARGWSVVGEFVEPGVSARTAERPELRRLLERCRAEPVPGAVLVHKVDRLARNVFDHATIRALLKRQGIRLASVVENVDETVSGELVENIMASIAQFYSSNLSEEVRKGMRQKVIKGGWPHLPPRGYIVVRRDEGRGSTVEPDPVLAPVVAGAFERYASGWFSLKSLSALLAREGLAGRDARPLSPSRVRHLLSNPFYCGRLRWNGLDVAGAHEALVSRETFERVQAALARRSKDPGAKGSAREFPLRGIAICASCRGHMTASRHKGKFGYYHCSRRGYDKGRCGAQGYCPSGKAAADAERICGTLALPAETVDAIRREAQRAIAEKDESGRRRLNSLLARRGKLAAKALRLTDAFVSGDLSAEAYKASTSSVRSALAALDSRIAQARSDPARLSERVDQMLARATSIRALGDALGTARRHELYRAVFGTVVLDKSGVVGFTLNAPFATLFESGPAQETDVSDADAAARVGRRLVGEAAS